MENLKTVWLIGTDHQYQLPHNKGSDEFRKLVAATCTSHDIKAIGEEMSLDGFKNTSSKQSVCKQVADSFRIRHCYCDPGHEERDKLGIPYTGKSDPYADAIRRRCWFEHILNLDSWPVLFVCGADHTKSFTALLCKNDIDVHILVANWKPT